MSILQQSDRIRKQIIANSFTPEFSINGSVDVRLDAGEVKNVTISYDRFLYKPSLSYYVKSIGEDLNVNHYVLFFTNDSLSWRVVNNDEDCSVNLTICYSLW